MDPFWMLAAEWWWVAPTAVGAGAVTAVGVRRGQRRSGRRLALDAARDDLRTAQREVAERRRAVKIARAELARLMAERVASRASAAEVASARRAVKQAEYDAKAAAADVRARRARVGVAQAELPAASRPDRYPLARLRSAHDAVTARWMEYETDPAKLIAYPVMSNGKDPAMAAFLTAARRARDLRPASDAGVTPEEYSAYRDAVADLERAFDVAEHTAKARAAGRNPDAGVAWQDSAQEMLTRSAEALDKAAGAAASVIAAWAARRKPDKGEPGER
ncbi:hypothetical protein HD600_002000 [Microbacterium ginsengiterrae]|uniref:Uncharacterized protein n=1 Tax=Microbacterium ginsengiterrae TaxID=546115 RepID=A0A7W9FDG9_9MICO|nr:hypothetical protein [Microbacterium ginsengiterrae]MBB5743503.1 hypothetical protein [Microbacterium ginsengiterrae]